MPNTLLHKRNSTANSTPAAGNLTAGELAINTADGRLFTKNSAGTVVNLPVTSIAGQSVSPSKVTTTAANSTTTGAGQIYLNGATGNRIDFNTNGVAPPDVTTRSAGTKICLYPVMNGFSGDYAIGINHSTFWQSVPSVTDMFQWYSGVMAVAKLDGYGNFSAASCTASSFFQNIAEVVDFQTVGVHNFYNSIDWGDGAVGNVGQIACYTNDSPARGCLMLRASAMDSQINVANLYDVLGVHSNGIIVKPPYSWSTPQSTLDVQGTATITGNTTIQGSLTVQGGLRSPGEMLYLWANFR